MTDISAKGAHGGGTDHHKWRIVDLSHNSSMYISYYLKEEKSPLFSTFLLLFSTPILCFLVLSYRQPPNLSLPLFVIHEAEVSFRPYVLVEACLQSQTHTNTLIFMSLRSHCVHMLSLVLCCCSAAHKLALSPRPRNKTQAVTPPPTRLPPINYTPLVHTHKHTMAPSVTKLLPLGSSYWPLCDFRASLFNKVL